jgi:hypothetical protein
VSPLKKKLNHLLIFVIAAYPATAAEAAQLPLQPPKALAAEAATEVAVVIVASMPTTALVKISQFIFQHH